MLDALLAMGLAGAAAVNSAAPGPSLLVVSSQAATEDLGSGLRVTLGIAPYDAILLLVAAAMILGALTLSDTAAETLHLGGPAVPVALALAMLAARPAPVATPVAGGKALGRLRPGDGALSPALGLSSPLNLLFMFALLPQFVDLGQPGPACPVLASAAVLFGGALPFVAACLLASRLRLRRPETARRFMRTCGTALLGVAGLALAATP